jgi:hypothetical protein
VLLACLLSGALVWSDRAAATRGVVAMLTIAAGNLIIFATYFVLMLWLLVQGLMRFPGFLKVRADLAGIQPVDE